MDLNLLNTFAAVAESGSFSGAARKLRQPKSSVSRGVAALEEQLGVRLFHRTTRQVSLSTAGAALYERVAPLLGQLRESVSALPESEEQPSGELRITASVDFGAALLAGLVARFAARYPAVTVDVRLTNEKVDLVAEGIDAALRFSTSERLSDSTLVARRVRPTELQLYASPEYLARRGAPRTPAELAEHDCVVMRRMEKLRLQSKEGAAAVAMAGRVRCDDMLFVLAATRGGAGIGCMPTFVAEDELASGRLQRVLPKWAVSSGYLWLVTPEARHAPRKVAAFRDFILETLGSRP